MNFIKTLNAKLTTTLFFTFAFLLSNSVLFGQTFGGFQLPSISGYVEDIQVVAVGSIDNGGTYHDVEYEVDLELDVDFGFHHPSNIIELSFDIELGGFDSWIISQDDLILDNENAQITVSPNMGNPNLYTITTVFSNGVSSTELAYQIDRAITSALVIDSSKDDYAKTADCYDYHIDQTATVEISNATLTTVSANPNLPLIVSINNSFYEEEFSLPSCIGKGIQPEAEEFNINLMIKEISPTSVNVDLYVSFYNSQPISNGAIPFVYSRPDLEEPTVNWSENVNGTIDNTPPLGAYIYFDNLNLDHSIEQQYLGTLTFDYKSVVPGSTTTSPFYVFNHAELWDVDGRLLTGITFDADSNLPVLDDEKFHIKHHALKLDKTNSSLISLKPNPAKGILSIETDFVNGDNTEVFVYNINGQKMDNINNYTNGTNQFQIDVSHLSNGTYVLKIASASTIAKSKFIIHR